MENLPLSYFAIGARRQYPQYWIIHYYVHITNDLYWLYTSWVCFSCRDVHFFFLPFQFLIRPISGMDKLIEQFVKLNTKLNRKLQPSQIFVHFYSIWNEIWNLSYVFFFIFGRKECLNFKNVETFTVKDEFRIILRWYDVTLTTLIKMINFLIKISWNYFLCVVW